MERTKSESVRDRDQGQSVYSKLNKQAASIRRNLNGHLGATSNGQEAHDDIR